MHYEKQIYNTKTQLKTKPLICEQFAARISCKGYIDLWRADDLNHVNKYKGHPQITQRVRPHVIISGCYCIGSDTLSDATLQESREATTRFWNNINISHSMHHFLSSVRRSERARCAFIWSF